MILTTLLVILTLSHSFAFQQQPSSSLSLSKVIQLFPSTTILHLTTTTTNNNNNNNDDISNLATNRFPTSIHDQIRQTSIAISNANKNNITRHSIRLLLPIIGPTELDDWPGGARQMMDAAYPLMCDIMQLVYKQTQDNDTILTTTTTTTTTTSVAENDNNNNNKNDVLTIQESIIDSSDGVRALFTQAPNNPKDDSCVILLPSADTVPIIQQLDKDVGEERNLCLVNSQWRRKTDFGIINNNNNNNGNGMFSSWFGGGSNNDNNKSDQIAFVEGFEPTFHCTNIMVEGDIVRILRTYPGPWRVYLRIVMDENNKDSIDWVLIGTKDVLSTKTDEWDRNTEENNGNFDGGKLFDYGIPTYQEILKMIVSRDDYTPKSLTEKASSAFTFIKDSL